MQGSEIKLHDIIVDCCFGLFAFLFSLSLCSNFSEGLFSLLVLVDFFKSEACLKFLMLVGASFILKNDTLKSLMKFPCVLLWLMCF